MKYLSSHTKRNSNQGIQKDSEYLDRRLTAIGCQNGWLGVYLVESVKNGKQIIALIA